MSGCVSLAGTGQCPSECNMPPHSAIPLSCFFLQLLSLPLSPPAVLTSGIAVTGNWSQSSPEEEKQAPGMSGWSEMNSADECDLNVVQAGSICTNYAAFSRFMCHPSRYMPGGGIHSWSKGSSPHPRVPRKKPSPSPGGEGLLAWYRGVAMEHVYFVYMADNLHSIITVG